MPSPLDQPEIDTPESAGTPNPSTSVPPPAAAAESSSAARQPTQPLAIEDGQPGLSGESAKEQEPIQSLDLGEGNVIKLDKLGPMIINSDGTMSRVQNWLELHPIEQERTVRLLVKKRNLVRLQKLNAEDKAAEGQGQKEEEPLTALSAAKLE